MDAWVRIWRGLPRETRAEAARAFWTAPADEVDEDAREEAEVFLRDAYHLRPKTVASLDAGRGADYLGRRLDLPPPVAQQALILLHLRERKELLAAFLDRLGVPHREGHIDGKVADGDPLPEPELAAAVDLIHARFPKERVDLYLEVLLAQASPRWLHLPAALEARRDADAAPAEREEVRDEEPESLRGGGFTQIDRLVERAVIASVGREEGALDDVQIRDAVDELVHLNQERHRSYFHLGLLDALQGRPAHTAWPESDEERRTWYLSGALKALMGQARAEEARALVAAHPAEFGRLGRGGHDATPLALPLLFDAVWSGPEPLSVVSLLQPEGLARSPGTLGKLLDAATALLREARGEEARRLVSLASEAADRLAAMGTPPPETFVRDLRRRRAHCLRLTGDLDGAARILTGLAAEPDADGKRGMILADLGVIACRLRSLADVRVPPSLDDWGAAERTLAPGEEWFRKALGLRGGHGEYCLGTLCVLRRRHAEARPLLERAVAEMQPRAEVYNQTRTLPRARLYLAYAIAEQVEAPNAEQVARLVREVGDRIDGEAAALHGRILVDLGLVDAGLAAELARTLLPRMGAVLLDAIGQAELLRRIPEARRALLARGREVGRGRGERFRDRKRVLEAALRADDRALAEEALDGLEELADRDPERQRFLDLLDNPDAHGGIWDDDEVDEARVRIHEMRGDVEAAATVLTGMAHRVLTRGGEHRLPVVDGIVERIRSYGLEPDRALLARAETRDEPPPPAAAPARGRIFFLGGNELQSRMTETVEPAIRRRWPGIELQFAHPAWSSNWGRQLEAWKDRIRSADAVVLMPLVRTQLGRAVRRLCGEAGIPWVPCTSKGAAGMERAIDYAIRLLARG